MNLSPGGLVGYLCRQCARVGSTRAFGRKTFASSAKSYRAVPSFAPSSSPELDLLFNEFREKVFLPDQLSPQHRHLIYRPKNQKILTDAPGVTVSVNEDEDIRLTPHNHNERPHSRANFTKIRNLLNSTDDDVAWDNLIPFIQGLKKSKNAYSRIFVRQIVSGAIRNGKSRVALTLLGQVKKTGCSLRDGEFASSILYEYHKRLVIPDLEGEELDSLFKDIDALGALLEREDHCGGISQTSPGNSSDFDSRRSLLAMAVFLEVAIARARTSSNIAGSSADVSKYLTGFLVLSETGIEDGSNPHIWRGRPSADEVYQISFNERPALQVLLEALDTASQLQSITETQQDQISARKAAIRRRIDTLAERSEELFNERERRRQQQGKGEKQSSNA